MNFSLYTQMMKTNLKTVLGFGLGSALYVTLMTSLFPMLDKNMEEIDKLIDIFPDAFLRAMGLESFSSYGQFVSAEYYGLFYLLILGVFSVMIAVQLIAGLVDRGSMAYLLSTRVSRVQIAVTQITVLISGLIVIHVLTFGGGFLAAEFLIDTESTIAFGEFFQINVVGFLLFFAVGGYSFLISSLFNDEKNAFALAGGLTFLFYGMNMMGKIVTDIDWIRDFTPFSLYEPGNIASGEADVLVSSATLGSIGIATCVIAVLIFRKRNLPL
ncbi:ABC transporter permease subunit [Barrientosiimonas marina]|uniref:ABC transporter permease subunit n=1 Tax=Lentibacillus kimchii TaxID=1542911 RepID=A0ABW2USF5_9BACI